MVMVDWSDETPKTEAGLSRSQVRQEIKKELFWSELRGKFRKFFHRLSCCFFLLIVLGGLIVAGLVVLNRTGLIKIPFIAEIFP